MEIEVKLYGLLRQYRPESADGAPHHPFCVVLGEGTTVLDAITAVSLPADLVAATAVNGEVAELNTPLHAGAQVSLYPPTAGGD